MEDRTLLTTFTVTNTGLGTGTTLDQAITASNAATPGPNLIDFNIPTTDPGFNAITGIWTIAPTTALPTIITPVTIDGTTQSPTATHPVIEVNGTSAGAFPTEGFTVDAGATTIRGLAIDQFSNYAIFLEISGGDTVVGNVIGLDPTGTTALGNRSGVLVLSISNNTIGGTTAADRNIISGNSQDGVDIQGTGTLIQGNVVAGNYVGTDITGTTALGNGGAGISILAASDNTIGGTVAGAGNVVSGNTGAGIQISIVTSSGQIASGNLVEGNLVGTDATGTRAVGNTGSGVIITDAAQNTVGGTVAAARNVIAANFEGVVLDENSAGLGTGNVIAGNYIGTDVNGTAALGNTEGVQVSTENDTIGGTAAGARNVISGNTADGIEFVNNANFPSTSGVLIAGNSIGLDATGAAALGNTQDGIGISGATADTIGGTTAGAGNVISGNALHGVNMSGTTGVLIEGNRIGTDATGTTGLGNGQEGITIGGTSTGDTIGGTVAGAGNVISGDGFGTGGPFDGLALQNAGVSG
ncbi:MAG TPA: hypothetical protein VG406_08315, partial [Isosphaeraceae bacterium]|nr:hypothetical protein [Isosphaeraceae bacterium]